MKENTIVRSPERRITPRHVAGFGITLGWTTADGENVASQGTTENIGKDGLLVHLPRELPEVGIDVIVTVVPEPFAPVSAEASVLRLVRNVGHPQVALQINSNFEKWEVEVYEYAAEFAERLAQRENEAWW